MFSAGDTFYENHKSSAVSFAFVNREHAAELTAKHPERLLGFGCFVPYDNGKILQESECAIKQYNLMRNSPLQSELASH